jgi:hypothetical protein
MQQSRRASPSSRPPPVSSGVHASLIDLNIVGGVLASAEIGVWQLFRDGPRLLASATAMKSLGLSDLLEGDGQSVMLTEDGLEHVHPADRERVSSEWRGRAPRGAPSPSS